MRLFTLNLTTPLFGLPFSAEDIIGIVAIFLAAVIVRFQLKLSKKEKRDPADEVATYSDKKKEESIMRDDFDLLPDLFKEYHNGDGSAFRYKYRPVSREYIPPPPVPIVPKVNLKPKSLPEGVTVKTASEALAASSE